VIEATRGRGCGATFVGADATLASFAALFALGCSITITDVRSESGPALGARRDDATKRADGGAVDAASAQEADAQRDAATSERDDMVGAGTSASRRGLADGAVEDLDHTLDGTADVTMDVTTDDDGSPRGDETSNGVSMIRAVIDGESFEFTRDLLTYNGRPPMMDIAAWSSREMERWFSLRIAVTPPSQASLESGQYPCGPDAPTFIMLSGPGAVFDSTTMGPCQVVVDSAGTTSGEVFSGTFEATLYTSDGLRAVVLEQGRFYGVVP